MKKEKIIIATIKSWNILNAYKLKKRLKNNYLVFVFTNKKELNYKSIKRINPKYIFFTHWSWLIPKNIYEDFECIVFHMTDLPYGRGGSPLQNLILKKVYNTKISALRVEKELDAGEIYLKEDFYIGEGSAEELFQRASDIIFLKMIPHILKNSTIPYSQRGKVVNFKRRTPELSDIASSDVSNLGELYDFIRMLDAPGYPRAFLRAGGLKIVLSGVYKKDNRLIGRFEAKNEK